MADTTAAIVRLKDMHARFAGMILQGIPATAGHHPLPCFSPAAFRPAFPDTEGACA